MNKLHWPRRPLKRTSAAGLDYKLWRSDGYEISSGGACFVCWRRFNEYDIVDDRQRCGMESIGRRRTLAAAQKLCQQDFNQRQPMKGKNR